MIKEPIVRDIVGYEGLYSIDIFGNVLKKSMKSFVISFQM